MILLIFLGESYHPIGVICAIARYYGADIEILFVQRHAAKVFEAQLPGLNLFDRYIAHPSELAILDHDIGRLTAGTALLQNDKRFIGGQGYHGISYALVILYDKLFFILSAGAFLIYAAIGVGGDAGEPVAQGVCFSDLTQVRETFGRRREVYRSLTVFTQLFHAEARYTPLVSISYNAKPGFIVLLGAVELRPQALDLVRLQQECDEFIAADLIADGMYGPEEILFLFRGRVIGEMTADTFFDPFCLAHVDHFAPLVVKVVDTRQVRQALIVLPGYMRWKALFFGGLFERLFDDTCRVIFEQFLKEGDCRPCITSGAVPVIYLDTKVATYIAQAVGGQSGKYFPAQAYGAEFVGI